MLFHYLPHGLFWIVGQSPISKHGPHQITSPCDHVPLDKPPLILQSSFFQTPENVRKPPTGDCSADADHGNEGLRGNEGGACEVHWPVAGAAAPPRLAYSVCGSVSGPPI